MSFFSGADAYDRFMGRYSDPLAPVFADFAGVDADWRVLDVGCGTGALTAELVARLGPERVAALDPTEGFVDAVRARHPGVEVIQGTAETMPFGDESFDAALAQLVVHFMSDPVAGLREMARVARTGGTVAACVWDMTDADSPLPVFWSAARELDSGVPGESDLPGARPGMLTRLFGEAGLSDVTESSISVTVEHRSFDEWWEPFTYGVGPVGVHLRGLGESQRVALRERCRGRLGDGPFAVTAVACAARGSVA